MKVEREEGCLFSKTGMPQPSAAREEEMHPPGRQCRQSQECELGKHPAGQRILQGPWANQNRWGSWCPPKEGCLVQRYSAIGAD